MRLILLDEFNSYINTLGWGGGYERSDCQKMLTEFFHLHLAGGKMLPLGPDSVEISFHIYILPPSSFWPVM